MPCRYHSDSLACALLMAAAGASTPAGAPAPLPAAAAAGRLRRALLLLLQWRACATGSAADARWKAAPVQAGACRQQRVGVMYRVLCRRGRLQARAKMPAGLAGAKSSAAPASHPWDRCTKLCLHCKSRSKTVGAWN